MNIVLWVLQVLLAVAFFAHGVMMVSATGYNLVRGEVSSAVITLILLVMAAFVACMWYRALPITARRTA